MYFTLRKGVENGTLKMAKETGKGSNSYKLDETKREIPAKKLKAEATADTEPVSKPNTKKIGKKAAAAVPVKNSKKN